MSMLVWYMLYLLGLFGLITAGVWWPQRRVNPFRWHGSIGWVGITMMGADAFFFIGLARADALVVVLALLRASGVVISFVGSGYFFGDVNLRQKAWVLSGILVGVLCILISGV